jgi:hypothetical protein
LTFHLHVFNSTNNPPVVFHKQVRKKTRSGLNELMECHRQHIYLRPEN